MRIAFVITELEVGGAERCLVHLATRIDRARFEPLVISLAPRPAPGKDSLVVALERGKVPVEFLGRRSVLGFGSAAGQLRRLLMSVRPEIVQTFLFHANVLGAMAARRAKVPRVLAGIRVADPRRWRAWVERWACREIERIVCVSEGAARHCRELGYPAGKLAVIPNGVDFDRFAGAAPIELAELGIRAGRKAIVFIGRLDKQKGLSDLLSICPRLVEALPDHDLVIVGEGPERAALVRQAARLGIASRVHLTGWRADVPAILAAADLLVLPSRWEGMPNVVLEAMAAGKPVVATRTAGIEEALGAQAELQSVAMGQRDQLAEKIVHLVQNPQVASQLGRANQARAKSEFSIDSMVDRYERLYASLCTANDAR